MPDPTPAPVALVTGGEGDLASALAQELGLAGYRVLAPGRKDLDVSRSESVDAFFSSLEPIDLLVNNAGIAGDGLLARQDAATWSEVIDVNLKGAFLCARAAAPAMLRRRSGHIVQVGSFAAHHPGIGQTAYASAKAGLEGLTRSLAAELGKRNIRVNCVLPGFLETKMTAPLGLEIREQARERHQLGRFNTPEEAARFIALLDRSPHVSGQVFQLDSRTG